jgi:plastocyanin
MKRLAMPGCGLGQVHADRPLKFAGWCANTEETLMKRHRWLAAAAVVAIGAVMLVAAACGSSSSTPATTASSTGGGTAAVVIKSFAYTPQTITVKAGTIVTWTNQDSAQHTVTSTDGISISANVTSAFDSGLFNQGQTFSFTFSKAGTYFYECTIHKAQAAMHGEVIVQ